MVKLNRKRSLQIFSGLMIILVCGGIAFGLHVRRTNKEQKTSGIIPTSQKSDDHSKSKASTTKQVGDTAMTTVQNDKQPTPSANASATLLAPFGSFVSNHKPGQNGSPTTEQSVCNTTPGATCDIKFTNTGGVTKNLGAQIADGDGVASWSWSIDGATLAPGNWQITATATLGNQIKTTTDPLMLEVQ